MKSRALSIAVCLSIVSAFAFGSACTSVPDRKVLPFGFSVTDAGQNGTGGSLEAGVGGTNGKGGSGTGGASRGGAPNADAGDAASSGGNNQGDGGVTCGSVSCTGFTGIQMNLPACCTGVGKDICGLDTTSIRGPGCLEPGQPGNVDPTCPSQTGGTGLNGAGCCLDRSSTCGITFSVPGGPDFGCADLSLFGSSTATPCTPACAATKGPCTTTADCCDASPKTAVCVPIAGTKGGLCSYYCTANADCSSGCCTILPNTAAGVCAPDTSACPAGCGKADATCTTDADCCAGNVCVASGADGPRICRAACTTSQQCAGTVCLMDSTTGEYACTRPYSALCLDTCVEANDGYCEDGGPGSDSSFCALGTDCTDCTKITGIAARLGGTGTCDDTCTTAKDGVCEDGGTGATSFTCNWGTDCKDCGPRLGICTDDCPSAHDKVCDDGGPNSASSVCSPGTDCADCGVRYGGRGQQPCDGTTSVVCQPTGGVSNGDVVDHSCECAECPWDAPDCGAGKYACDGLSISACCAPGNPCGFDGDGVCDCGGWCDWETSDCQIAGPPKCDGISISSYCSFTSQSAPDQFCDCGGACSWEAPDCATDYPNYLCTDTCSSAGDGQCDDSSFCTYGTDCADCGPRL